MPDKPTLEELVAGLKLLAGHLGHISANKISSYVCFQIAPPSPAAHNCLMLFADAHDFPTDDICAGRQSSWIYVPEDLINLER